MRCNDTSITDNCCIELYCFSFHGPVYFTHSNQHPYCHGYMVQVILTHVMWVIACDCLFWLYFSLYILLQLVTCHHHHMLARLQLPFAYRSLTLIHFKCRNTASIRVANEPSGAEYYPCSIRTSRVVVILGLAWLVQN